MTLPIIILTAFISVIAFSQSQVMNKLQFNAWMVHHKNEWFRFITHAFVHADWIHLLVNMFVLYSFGPFVERNFLYYFGATGKYYYLLMYFGAIIAAVITTYRKNKDNVWYNSVGASGAVSAVLFSSVIFNPFMKIYLYGLIGLPAIAWAGIYIFYSIYMSKRGGDMVNHEAHLWGGVFGMALTLLLSPRIATSFIQQLGL